MKFTFRTLVSILLLPVTVLALVLFFIIAIPVMLLNLITRGLTVGLIAIGSKGVQFCSWMARWTRHEV